MLPELRDALHPLENDKWTLCLVQEDDCQDSSFDLDPKKMRKMGARVS